MGGRAGGLPDGTGLGPGDSGCISICGHQRLSGQRPLRSAQDTGCWGEGRGAEAPLHGGRDRTTSFSRCVLGSGSPQGLRIVNPAHRRASRAPIAERGAGGDGPEAERKQPSAAGFQ